MLCCVVLQRKLEEFLSPKSKSDVREVHHE